MLFPLYNMLTGEFKLGSEDLMRKPIISWQYRNGLSMISSVLLLSLFSTFVIDAQSVPFSIGVPATESGRDVFVQWGSIVSEIARITERDIRLIIESTQTALADGMRSRRLDLVLIDPITAAELSNEFSIEFYASVFEFSEYFGTNRRFALIAPAQSRVFLPQHIMENRLSIPSPELYPSAVAYASLIFKNEGLLLPELEYTDTEHSILKGVSYGHLQAGLIGAHHLRNPTLGEFTERIRVIAKSEKAPPWFMVGRKDSIGVAHREIVHELIARWGSDQDDTFGSPSLVFSQSVRENPLLEFESFSRVLNEFERFRVIENASSN